MRLNGTYFDRLIINVLPLTAFAGIVLHFTKKNSIIFEISLFIGMTLFFWIIDSLIIYFKRLQKLRIDNAILFDDIEILPKEILRITPITDKRNRWTFKTIQFQIRRNNIEETFSILEKPTTLIQDLMKKESKTLTLLFNQYPELKNKLTMDIPD